MPLRGVETLLFVGWAWGVEERGVLEVGMGSGLICEVWGADAGEEVDVDVLNMPVGGSAEGV